MILIRNVRLVDARGERGPADVLIGEGRILSLEGGEAKQVVDGTGCFLAPGFLDLHAHLREPGEEVKEDLFSGLLAAVRGGYTDLVSMPNTKPPVDTPEAVRALKEKAKSLGLARRRSASSKEILVLVEGSKKTVATVKPWRAGTFFMGRSRTSRITRAVSRRLSTSVLLQPWKSRRCLMPPPFPKAPPGPPRPPPPP